MKGRTETGLFGVSDSGVYAAQSLTNKGTPVSSAICSTVAPIKFPGSVANYAYQVSDSTLITTTWIDRKSVTHGGIYSFSDSTYQAVGVPVQPSPKPEASTTTATRGPLHGQKWQEKHWLLHHGESLNEQSKEGFLF